MKSISKIMIISILCIGLMSVFATHTIRAVAYQPQINNEPEDMEYQYGVTGNSISWNITDEDDPTVNYTIYKDGVQDATGIHQSGDILVFNVDGLLVGTYNYTIIVSDGSLTARDTVFVTVTAPDLSIEIFLNPLYDGSSDTISVNWTAYGYDQEDPSYKILWENGTMNFIDITDLNDGNYTITIQIHDGIGTEYEKLGTFAILTENLPNELMIPGYPLVGIMMSITIGLVIIVRKIKK